MFHIEYIKVQFGENYNKFLKRSGIMPRIARLKSPELTYHIIVRGNNRENIFYCDADRIRYLKTLKKFKIKYNFTLYAYVLMDNHVHMIINSNGEDISKIMQSINISYTYYFNKVYNRVGHLFQDRFKSIIVDDDSYIINLSKYIHNNPKRAGIVPEGNDYIWSSCRNYTTDTEDVLDILDSDFILRYYSDDINRAKLLYQGYMLSEDDKQLTEHSIQNPPTNPKPITIKPITQELLESLSKIYNLPLDDLLMKNNRRCTGIRNECLYIVRMKSRENYNVIGRVFGQICDSTVSWGINSAIDKMMEDKDSMARVGNILNQIG